MEFSQMKVQPRRITGKGSDDVGDFKITGRIRKNLDLMFKKEYLDAHTLWYKGTIDEDY